MLDILKGRSGNLINNFRKLKTDKNSRIIMIITSHGGENFIKVRGRTVILSDELNRALNEMYIKERYKEILFILDTCEGFSLFEYVNAPNIYFVTSSVKHQKAHSYSYDKNQMTPTADRFHFKLLNYLENIYKRRNFKLRINDLFVSLQNEKQFIESDVTIQNDIKREIIFEEFFGNYLKNNKINVKYNYTITNKIYLDRNELNYQLIKNKNITDQQVLNIKKYSERSYKFSEEKNTRINTEYSNLVMNFIFSVLFLYLTIN